MSSSEESSESQPTAQSEEKVTTGPTVDPGILEIELALAGFAFAIVTFLPEIDTRFSELQMTCILVLACMAALCASCSFVCSLTEYIKDQGRLGYSTRPQEILGIAYFLLACVLVIILIP